MRLRHRSGVRPRPALRERRVRLRRGFLPQRLLPKQRLRDVHSGRWIGGPSGLRQEWPRLHHMQSDPFRQLHEHWAVCMRRQLLLWGRPKVRQRKLRLRLCHLLRLLLAGRAKLRAAWNAERRVRQEWFYLSKLRNPNLRRRPLQQLHERYLHRMLLRLGLPYGDARPLSPRWGSLPVRAGRLDLPFVRDHHHGYMQCRRHL